MSDPVPATLDDSSSAVACRRSFPKSQSPVTTLRQVSGLVLKNDEEGMLSLHLGVTDPTAGSYNL